MSKIYKWDCLKNNKWNRFVVADTVNKVIFDTHEVFSWEWDDINDCFLELSVSGYGYIRDEDNRLKDFRFAIVCGDSIEIV